MPANADGERSATLAVHLFQNFAGPGVYEELRYALAKFASLVWRRAGALADVLCSVGRADDGVDCEFAAFESRPGAQRNLAAAFKGGEQSAFGDDGLSSFKVIEPGEGVGNFSILEARLNAQCALADRGHADFR